MRRKLFVIVITLTAIFVSVDLALPADRTPSRKTPEPFVKPTISDKQQATSMSKVLLAEKRDAISIFPEQPPQESANIGLLSPGIKIYAAPVKYTKDFCDLYGAPVYAITDWFNDHSTHENYQDPAEFGCTDVWPFQITEVGFNIQVDSAMDIDIQGFVVDADFTSPDCPTPGFPRCQTPVYTVSLPSGGHWIVNLPFDVECCMHGPYFAAVCIWSDLSEAGAHAVAEDDPTDVCRSYVPTAYGWRDLVADFGWPGEILLWSAGYTNLQNDCPGGPGQECRLHRDNGTVASYGAWNVGDQQAAYFDPPDLCTQCSQVYPLNVTGIEAVFYDFAGVNSLDATFRFYEASDICNGPGVEIYSFQATITDFYPDVAVVPTAETVCLQDDFFLACEYNSGPTGLMPSLAYDNNPPVDTCMQWNEYLDYGWIEWWDFWTEPEQVGWIMLRPVGECSSLDCYPGEECNMIQGSGVAASYFASWNFDDKVAKYYDPQEYCTTPVYPYRISHVEVALYDFAGAGSSDVRVGIYLECRQPCDGPGTKIFLSEPVTVDQFYPSLASIDLPDTVCLYEPFFVGVEYASGIPGQIPSLLFDDGSVPMDTCHAWVWYDGYSPPWWEWSDFWSPPLPGVPMIYVNGYTESPTCDIPSCDTSLEMLYGGIWSAYYWKQPPNDPFINMQFEMPGDHGGRLEGFQVAWYGGGSSGTPNPDFYVWLSDGTFPLDNNAPYQSIADFHISYEDIVFFPGYTRVWAYPRNVVFDPGEIFHIGFSHAFEPGDTLAILSDDGAFYSQRSSGWTGTQWEDYWPYEFYIDAIICPFSYADSTFLVKCTPYMQVATPGDPPANLYQVWLESVILYDLPITLSLLSVDPPAGIYANFSPNGAPCPYTSDVAINVDPSVPYADYTLTFEAFGEDGQSKTCDVWLMVQRPYDEVLVHFDHGVQRTSNFGALGNSDFNQNFVWYGSNYLYDGTIISAVEGYPQEDHMAFQVYDCECMRFIPTRHLATIHDPWCSESAFQEYFGEIAYAHFHTDPNSIPGEHDSLFVIGLKDVDSTDFSIKIRIHYNPTDASVPELWSGVFEDWEAGDYYSNWGDMDTLHNLMYIYDVADPSTVFGIMSVPFYDQSCHNMTFVHNPTEVYPSGDSCFLHNHEPGPAYMYRLMTAPEYRYPGYWSPDPDDYSALITSPPFSLNPGEEHIEIWIDFGRNLNDGLTWEQWWHKILRYVGCYRGDVNASDTLELPALDVSDLVYMQNYLFKGGPAPLPFADQGNVDGKGPYAGGLDFECPKNNVDVQDMIYLLNYIYRGGPPPVDYVRFIPSMWSRPSLFTNPLWN